MSFNTVNEEKSNQTNEWNKENHATINNKQVLFPKNSSIYCLPLLWICPKTKAGKGGWLNGHSSLWQGGAWRALMPRLRGFPMFYWPRVGEQAQQRRQRRMKSTGRRAAANELAGTGNVELWLDGTNDGGERSTRSLGRGRLFEPRNALLSNCGGLYLFSLVESLKGN